MSKSKIGAQLYTLRDFTKTPADIARTLKKVHEIGYEIVQVSAFGPIDPGELRKILDGEGLYASSTHTGYDRIVKETEKVMEEHKIIGAKHVVCPGLPGELHNAEGYKKVAQELTKAGETLSREKFVLSYHNHGIEFEKYAEVAESRPPCFLAKARRGADSRPSANSRLSGRGRGSGSVRGDRLGIEILMGESDPRYLQMELDTYWAQYGGADPAQWCLKFKGRLPLLHCKDMGIKANKPIMMEIGEGNLNWKAIFEACEKAGTECYLVEQDICYRDPFESLKISFENMKKMGL